MSIFLNISELSCEIFKRRGYFYEIEIKRQYVQLVRGIFFFLGKNSKKVFLFSSMKVYKPDSSPLVIAYLYMGLDFAQTPETSRDLNESKIIRTEITIFFWVF